jgi:hypothetical protein
MNNSIAMTAIEKNRSILEQLSRTIWQNPEGPFQNMSFQSHRTSVERSRF